MPVTGAGPSLLFIPGLGSHWGRTVTCLRELWSHLLHGHINIVSYCQYLSTFVNININFVSISDSESFLSLNPKPCGSTNSGYNHRRHLAHRLQPCPGKGIALSHILSDLRSLRTTKGCKRMQKDAKRAHGVEEMADVWIRTNKNLVLQTAHIIQIRGCWQQLLKSSELVTLLPKTSQARHKTRWPTGVTKRLRQEATASHTLAIHWPYTDEQARQYV